MKEFRRFFSLFISVFILFLGHHKERLYKHGPYRTLYKRTTYERPGTKWKKKETWKKEKVNKM